MPVVVILIALLALASPAMAAPSALKPVRIEHINVMGRDYVQVQDWAAARGWSVRWIVKLKVLGVYDGTNMLQLTVSAAQAEFNGIKVWLNHAVLMNDGRIYFSQFDVQNTIEPLFNPPKNPSSKKLRLVVLDPGHGGRDTGNRVLLQSEKTHTLLLAQEVRELLKRSGIKVALTRTDDTFVDLDDRPTKADRMGADLFVSLHYNATTEDRNNVKGVEVYCLTPAGASSTNAKGVGADSPWTTGNRNNGRNLCLAYQIQKSLVHNVGANDRGVRRARFAVLRDTPMPAVLIEAGFMTHPVEGKQIFTAAYRRQLARAIANGILGYERATTP